MSLSKGARSVDIIGEFTHLCHLCAIRIVLDHLADGRLSLRYDLDDDARRRGLLSIHSGLIVAHSLKGERRVYDRGFVVILLKHCLESVNPPGTSGSSQHLTLLIVVGLYGSFEQRLVQSVFRYSGLLRRFPAGESFPHHCLDGGCDNAGYSRRFVGLCEWIVGGLWFDLNGETCGWHIVGPWPSSWSSLAMLAVEGTRGRNAGRAGLMPPITIDPQRTEQISAWLLGFCWFRHCYRIDSGALPGQFV